MAGARVRGSVLEFRRWFIEMTGPLENNFNDLAIGKFIVGLRPEIVAKLRVFEPNSLGRALDLVQKIEVKIQLVEKGGANAHWPIEAFKTTP